MAPEPSTHLRFVLRGFLRLRSDKTMERIEVLASLVELAERTGIRVRFDRFDPRTRGSKSGGLCIVGGCPMVIVDASASLADQIAVIAGVLADRGVRALYVPRPLARRHPRRARNAP